MHTHRLVRTLLYVVIASLALGESAKAQFNVPLPKRTPSDRVFREDMQMLFHAFLFRDTREYEPRVQQLRQSALRAREAAGVERTRFDSVAKAFCRAKFGAAAEKAYAECAAALEPNALIERFGENVASERPLSRTYIKSIFPIRYVSRPAVAEYLRESGGGDAFSFASQFAANVGKNEAYLLTTIVRGLVGRGIFSADQALVVARSEDPDPAKRQVIEGDKANAVRAINNGGTLVARFTTPIYVRSGSTAATAIGLSASAGVLGPITGDETERNGSASTAFEWQMAFPVRDLGGNSTVLADLMVGFRAGYTYGGKALRGAGGAPDVSFGQMIVGLRQNGAVSVSALVTVANHGMNTKVPRLAVNFAAQQ